MKTFIKVILIVAAGMAVVAGCAKKSQITDLQDQIDALKSDQIQTIAGQISAISASLTSLQNTDTQLKAYIETLQGQASNLETTSKSLEDAIAKLKEDLTNEITTAKSEVLKQLETLKASIDVELKTLKDTIENLQKKDEDLQTQIDELKKYAETELKNAKDWATATFATLEQYNKTAEIVAGIQGQIETINDELVNAKKYTDDVKAELDNAIASLKTALQTEIKNAADAAAQALTTASEEIKKAYTEAIEAAITASETSIKTWVNEQLSAYYTAELIDSKLEALQTALENKQNSRDENLKNLISTLEKDVNAEIADLKQALADQKADIETAYTKAINDAITANNGTIDTKIEAAIKTVNSSISALKTKIINLEFALSALTDRVTAIEEGLKSLTSIVYIPTYSDNKARVHYDLSGSGYIGNNLDLDFDVYPATSADAIVAAYQKDNSALSARAVYTLTKASAGEFAYLEILNVKADDGILKVQVSTEKLDDDFFRGYLAAALVLKLTTGYNNLQSDYVHLTPVFRVESVTLDKTTVTLEPCDTVRLKATVAPANAYDQTVTWTTSDSNVATVDAKGLVTADRGGTATITATTTDGNFKATCTVTVNDEDVTAKFDEAFLAALKKQGYISSTATTVMKSDTYKIQEISSYGGSMTTLKGIECLANLKSLYLTGVYFLKSVDISQNKKLTSLSIHCCSFTVDVSQNKELETLFIDGCNLTSLDVSQNVKLQFLEITSNQDLTSIDVSKNTKLTNLIVKDNGLTSLDVSQNAKLQHLSVENNELTSIDISNCQNLTKFYCERNPGDSDSKFIVTVWKGFDITGLNFPAAGSVWSNITLEYKEK